ncbi:MAG: tRNA threonylcarbamoyladenosine dehydratase [Lachnospiraceae bacterium]|nr:tRNA threonylcarbamoyladenosine dehydratase [Lachnospiraceae bacterium]
MTEQLSRTAKLIGKENIERLASARVAVFGIGGVGGFTVEALARSGIGHIELIDHDTVALSNLNRQIIATRDTIGRDKVEVMKERILSINPDAEVVVHKCFFLPENKDEFDFSKFTYVVDAVDTVNAKLTIIEEAKKAGVPVISSMGTGNKLDPTKFEVADISKTSVCPLAKVMRRELKKRGISHVKVVYSKEEAMTPLEEGAASTCSRQNSEESTGRIKVAPGSISFVPSVAGLIIAGEVIKDICNI